MKINHIKVKEPGKGNNICKHIIIRCWLFTIGYYPRNVPEP